MHYTDRLEQELRDAMRREEAARRRPGRPPLRAALRPAAGLLAAVAVVVVLAGQFDRPSEERAAAPPKLFGDYVLRANDDEVRVVLVPGGFLMIGETIHINGVLEVKGNRLKFVRPSENEIPEAVGGHHVSSLGLPQYLTPLERRDCILARSATYRWTLAGDELLLEPVRDPCRARRDYLSAGALRRAGD